MLYLAIAGDEVEESRLRHQTRRLRPDAGLGHIPRSALLTRPAQGRPANRERPAFLHSAVGHRGEQRFTPTVSNLKPFCLLFTESKQCERSPRADGRQGQTGGNHLLQDTPTSTTSLFLWSYSNLVFEGP